jgi:glycerol-3-phosphate acyltransferase PlsY
VRFKLGPGYGILASILDMLKVAIPVAAFQTYFPGSQATYFSAAGGILGHNWPVFHKFKGGYGISAMFGALLVIEWTAIPVNFLVTGILYLILRQVHLASIGGVILLIPWLWYLDHDIYALLFVGLCVIAYSIRYIPDALALRVAYSLPFLPDNRAFREIEKKRGNPEIDILDE